MESLEQKLDRITGDVNTLVELYEYAEKLHPYHKTRNPVEVSFSNQSIPDRVGSFFTIQHYDPDPYH
jgi:hypothetical protein